MSSTLKAVVQDGRLVIEDIDYPDGTELELAIVAEGLDESNRAELDLALDQSWAQARSGQARPMSDVIAELRARGTTYPSE